MKFKPEEIDILRGMLEESTELLKDLEQKILLLEQNQSKEAVNDVFRVFHSIKGLAGFANVSIIVEVSHALESVLKKIRDEGAPIKPKLIDLLLDGGDLCKFVLQKISTSLESYSGGDLEVQLEDLGEKELIEQAKAYFEREQEPRTDEKKIEVLPDGFEREAFSDFLDELDENITEIENNLVEFEKHEDPTLLNAIMRGAHSIKGGARLLLSITGGSKDSDSVKYIEKISHKIEDALQKALQKSTEVDLHMIFRGLDLIKMLDDCLKKGATPDEKELQSFLSDTSFVGENEVKTEEVAPLASHEAFFNVASQLIEFVEFLISDSSADRSELARIAEPLKAGLEIIGHPEKIEMIDRIVKAGESGNIEELRKLSEEFLSWLNGKEESIKSVPQTVSAQQTTERQVSQTVRVKKTKLDTLVNLVGELITLKNTVKYLTNEIISRLPQMQSELKSVALKLERLSYDFQSCTMSLRMTPIGELFQRYNRTVRDLAKSLGKKVVLITEGEEVELDRSILELLSDPLTHLVRNAIDHGIEEPDQRKKIGKPEQGTLTLRAYYRGNFVFVEVQDDGRGIDAEKVRIKAIERELAPQEQILQMSEEEVIQFIFYPGFSTAEKVSNLSGRGVGMDVVKTNVESIGGKVLVKSEPGKGTTVTMMIPLSLMAVKGLLVRIGTDRYVIPTELVKEALKVPAKSLYKYKDMLFTQIRGEIVPVFFTEQLLTQSDLKISEKRFNFDLIPLIVVQDQEAPFAIIVDSFIEEGDYLVKSVPEMVRSNGLVSGATVMGDGSIVLILDLSKLIR